MYGWLLYFPKFENYEYNLVLVSVSYCDICGTYYCVTLFKSVLINVLSCVL